MTSYPTSAATLIADEVRGREVRAVVCTTGSHWNQMIQGGLALGEPVPADMTAALVEGKQRYYQVGALSHSARPTLRVVEGRILSSMPALPFHRTLDDLCPMALVEAPASSSDAIWVVRTKATVPIARPLPHDINVLGVIGTPLLANGLAVLGVVGRPAGRIPLAVRLVVGSVRGIQAITVSILIHLADRALALPAIASQAIGVARRSIEVSRWLLDRALRTPFHASILRHREALA